MYPSISHVFLAIGSEFAVIYFYFTMALSTIRRIDRLSCDKLIVSVKELSRLTKRWQAHIATL
jgi:hypothetical protein